MAVHGDLSTTLVDSQVDKTSETCTVRCNLMTALEPVVQNVLTDGG